MSDPQKKNININILASTDEKLEEVARITFRNKGAVIDWLVSKEYAELTIQQSEEKTIEEK